MLPEEFTMTQLRTVYEAVWNTTLAAGNFTRKMLPHLQDTGLKSKASIRAPAALFTRHRPVYSSTLVGARQQVGQLPQVSRIYGTNSMWESVAEGLPAQGWGELDENGWGALIG
jgi:hypothetical protein